MTSVLFSLLLTLRGMARSRAALHLEVLALRHQLEVLQRSQPRRLRLVQADRWLWTWLSRVWTAWRTALVIVKPETVMAWHRRGFRFVWTWKSRRRTGRPTAPADLRALIRTISQTNPFWGAPRIHGELLKLGMDVSQATVAKYMVRRRQPPSQTWRTFLGNHIGQVMAADFFVVPTATPINPAETADHRNRPSANARDLEREPAPFVHPNRQWLPKTRRQPRIR